MPDEPRRHLPGAAQGAAGEIGSGRGVHDFGGLLAAGFRPVVAARGGSADGSFEDGTASAELGLQERRRDPACAAAFDER